MKIVSTPGGATVSINGRRVGKTPMTTVVPGFTNHTVELRRAGFRTHHTRFYSRRPDEVVAARLDKAGS